ncbi:MAG TPA: porin family protein [Gammaproteobacteria bacterium]|nr:porin family protein [Gammaproteobacteria bacterium]
MQGRIIGLMALAAAGFAGPAAAAENPLYAGGGVSVEGINSGDDGFAAMGRFGVKMDNVLPGFAVEGEVSRSLVDPQTAGNNDITFTTLGGYAVYTAPLPDRRVSLRGRLGLVWVNADPDNGGSDSDTRISWGLGGEYRISSGLSAFVDYTRVSSTLDHLNGGVLVHF